jgi:hypothetical protein
LLPHPRWSRLLSAFASEDQLLVLAAPIGAPGVDDLVNQLEGLVLVDSLTPARVDVAKVISNVVLAPQPLPRLSQVVQAPPPQPTAPKKKPAAQGPNSGRVRTVNPTVRPSVLATQPVRRQTTVIQAFAKPAGYGAGLSILLADEPAVRRQHASIGGSGPFAGSGGNAATGGDTDRPAGSESGQSR